MARTMTANDQDPGTDQIVDDEGIQDVDQSTEVIPYRYEITAYGADYPVDSLVKRLNNEDIIVPTFDPDVGGEEGIVGFQRQFVWTKPQSDRFIESLLLGFPVPGIFLVRQTSGVLLVLDGHQRLRTLQAFYAGVLRDRVYKLGEVQEQFKGLRHIDLDPDDRRRLDDSIIHATIIRQDQPSEDQSSVYLIFERLNTGGTNLQPQEIRVALYRGKLLSLLRQLNDHAAWRSLYGQKSKQLKDHELILRFLAMLERRSEYERPMKDFLNKYMASRSNVEDDEANRLTGTFGSTADIILEALGDRAFRLGTAVNAAVLDSVMVGVAVRLEAGAISDPQTLSVAYDSLIQNEDFLQAVERATADEDAVQSRMALSIEAFAGVS